MIGDAETPRQRPPVLTIAGSDPSGGAGLQADLKTFHQLGVYGMAVPTLLTVQSTQGVESVAPVDPDLVRRQLDCLQRDIPPVTAKTGALGDAAVVSAVADWIRQSGVPLVVDPVMTSESGSTLANQSTVEALSGELLPLCCLVTPNLDEASALAGMPVRDLDSMREAATRIAGLGAANVLVTGGHLEGAAIDLLWTDGASLPLEAPHVETIHTHGSGCTHSAAITALLALGQPLGEAVTIAKRFVTEAIRTAPAMGRGRGPLNHHAARPAGLD